MDGGNGPFDDGRGPHQNAFIAGQQPLPSKSMMSQMQANPNQILGYTFATKAADAEVPVDNRTMSQKLGSNHITVIYGAAMPPDNKKYYTNEYTRLNRENEQGQPDYKMAVKAQDTYASGMCLLLGGALVAVAYWIYVGSAIPLY